MLLGNWRAAIIVSTAIPLSFLFAITGMVETKLSGNLMSLGAVDFGLIIDGAVVMVENIVRRLGLRQHELGRLLTNSERLHTVRLAALEVGRPTFFGVLIITIVYIPLLSLVGVEGKMFKPMALTVIYALVGALVLTLTLMPVLCSYFLTGRISEKDNFAITFLKRIYEPVLRTALRLRWLFVGGAVALFAVSLLIFSRLGAEFIPQLDEGSFATHMIRTTSIGLDASIAMQERAEKVLLEKFPGVTYTFSRIGTAEVATDPMGVNVADTYIFYKPLEDWPKIGGKTATKDALADRMSAELGVQVPGQAYLFSQPIEMRFNEILEGTRADIAVKVFGDDFAEIERIAGEVREILEKVPGAADVEFDALGKAPLLEVSPNREAMAKYNVHAEEINQAVETAMAGGEPGTVIDGNRRYPIVVRMPETLRQKIDEMKRLPLRTSDGGLVTLGQVADFTMSEKVNTISREMGQRRAAIMVNLRGRDVESFVLEAQKKVAEQVKLPPGYTIEFGGQFKNLQEACARLGVIVPAALLIIFVLIFLAFGSIRQALLIYTGIPLAVTGGIFALWARGMPFSISAGVGFIALSGVAVLNGLMMVSYYNQLRESGKSLFDSIIEGSLTRLRPVMMTAMVASLGFLPMALGSGAGAEVQRPLATVVIGGIISSTFLTLVVLPILYQVFESRSARAQGAGSTAMKSSILIPRTRHGSLRRRSRDARSTRNPRGIQQPRAAILRKAGRRAAQAARHSRARNRPTARLPVASGIPRCGPRSRCRTGSPLPRSIPLRPRRGNPPACDGIRRRQRRSRHRKDLADRISALVKMLAERPSAGVESLIERRILEGAALPFVKDAAELPPRQAAQERKSTASPAKAPMRNFLRDRRFRCCHQNVTDIRLRPTACFKKIRSAEIERGISGLGSASELEAYSGRRLVHTRRTRRDRPARGRHPPGRNLRLDLGANQETPARRRPKQARP